MRADLCRPLGYRDSALQRRHPGAFQFSFRSDQVRLRRPGPAQFGVPAVGVQRLPVAGDLLAGNQPPAQHSLPEPATTAGGRDRCDIRSCYLGNVPDAGGTGRWRRGSLRLLPETFSNRDSPGLKPGGRHRHGRRRGDGRNLVDQRGETVLTFLQSRSLIPFSPFPPLRTDPVRGRNPLPWFCAKPQQHDTAFSSPNSAP